MTMDIISRDALNKCFDIFDDSHSQKLYNSTKLLLEERVLQLLSIVQTENTANLLENYHGNWLKYCKSKINLDYCTTTTLQSNDKKRKFQVSFKVSLPKLLIDEINKLQRTYQ
eukprot:XP_016657540.1 PREDICTED: uncharacterized protein LOC107882914 [Acyrthosiphon pisum]